MTFKEMKFRVRDGNHSVQIQRELFNAGYKWYTGGGQMQYTDKPYLYTSDGGFIAHSGHVSGVEFFNKEAAEEYELSSDGTLVLASAGPKIVEHEGVKYKVPGWAKYLTRDGKDNDVFAWEDEPRWTGGAGYQTAKGLRTLVKPYVEPLPEGNFIKEI